MNRPIAWEYCQMQAGTWRMQSSQLWRQTLKDVETRFQYDSMSLSSLTFLWWAPKNASFLQECVLANGHSRSSDVDDCGTNRKRVFDFRLVPN